MLIVVFVVSIVIIFVGIVLYGSLEHCGIGGFACILGGVFALISFTIALIAMAKVIGVGAIDQKIQLYEDANTTIEERINETVKEYKEYENDTLKKFNGSNGTEVVSLYPELKANELIQEQMEIYYKNQTTILSLKEEKISKKPWQWLLYFGG